jgi:GNAT superfamily N-acetyltransferase
MAVMEDISALDVELRHAGAAELPALSQLYVQVYEAHDASITVEASFVKLEKMLQAPGQRGLLFRHDGLQIGFIVWADLGDHVFIRDYVIDKAFRGRGLGAGIFSRICAEALPSGKPIRLETSADHALRFWTEQGFTEWSSGMRTDAIQEHH